jgi:hypothetical protein
MEGLVMSLSAWEQQALDSIKDGLTGSDPQLAVLLTTFTRLAADEEMPIREEILPGTRQTILSKPRRRASVRRRSRRMCRGLALQWVLLLLWLVTTVVLITIAALVFSHDGGQGPCPGSWASVCSHSAPG